VTPDLTTEEKALVREVVDCTERSEKILKPYRDLCNGHYREYRGVRAYREAFRRADRPDRDLIAREAATDWGADFDLPIAYSTVETILPRAVSNRPRGLVLPEELEAEENVENMRMLIDSQQGRMGYELTNQETAKSGFLYGLGAQKETWRTEVQKGAKYVKRATSMPRPDSPEYVQGEKDRTLYDGPWIEDVDIFDLFWDERAYMDGLRLVCGWLTHRTWRDDDYVIEMVKSGIWNTKAAQALTPEDVPRIGDAENRYDESTRDRLDAAGMTRNGAPKVRIHEVLEYHHQRSGNVITVLDRQIPVQVAPNPYWHGDLPFHFYRPTSPGIKQLQGIGEIEPIAELIREQKMLRSQRRDNATVKLQQVFAFDPDAVDRNHLKFGPGIGIPVRGTGSVRDFLMPINVGDIPFSSYRESEENQSDIDRTSGISDALTGAQSSSQQTATGANLELAAANVRIEMKSRRLELETVTRATTQQIALNQQKIVSEKDVRVPYEPEPGETDPKLWRFIKLSPAELAGQMSFVVDGGAMAPKNPAQESNLGLNTWNALQGNPLVDQSWLARHFMESQGIKQAQAHLVPPAPTVPPEVIDALRKKFGPGVDEVIGLMAQASQNGNGQPR
jgi:hypothetical protein